MPVMLKISVYGDVCWRVSGENKSVIIILIWGNSNFYEDISNNYPTSPLQTLLNRPKLCFLPLFSDIVLVTTPIVS